MFHFTEQFSNSPYTNLIKNEEIERIFEPIFSLVQNGIERKVIKNVTMDILTAFILFPIITLSNKKICKNFQNIVKPFF